MNMPRHRPLSVGPIRAFEAVARLLSFRAAAEELHLTQSAISRQIRSLEEEVGALLFQRGTRHVELTGDGALLLRAVIPALERLDTGVRQIRSARGRKIVSVTTFASFSSLWLIPRLEAFQRVASRHRHPHLGQRRADRPRRARHRPGAALLHARTGAAGRGAHVRRDAHAGHQPVAGRADRAMARRRRWRGQPIWPATRSPKRTTNCRAPTT